jgi:hypothetical protein
MFKKSKKEEAVIEEEIVEEVVAPVEEEVVEEEVTAAPVGGLSYNGSEIVERMETVNSDGRLCKLADGTTAFVPLSILGE